MAELQDPERTPDTRDQDADDGLQASQRMLSFSDALLSIIATVMVREHRPTPDPTQSLHLPQDPLPRTSTRPDPLPRASALPPRAPPRASASPRDPVRLWSTFSQGPFHLDLVLQPRKGRPHLLWSLQVLPVMHTKICPDQRLDSSTQRLLATRIAVYLMTFLIVTVAWAAHTRLFQVIGKADDTLALLNLVCMMTITFLPYTFSLMVTFPAEPLGIFLFCMCVIAIGAAQAVIVGYAFHFPHLLDPRVASSAHRAALRRHLLGALLRGPALCLAAALFSLLFFPVSYLLLVAVVVLPYVGKATGWCWERLRGPRELPSQSPDLFHFDLYEPLSKERVEAFSDGVYAIVATLLILDICEDNVPEPADVEGAFHGSLVAALGASGPRFLAYFGAFATVGLLWFAHHSLFLHVREATQPMGALNALALAFVGGLPLAYRQTSALARQPREELESIRVSCAIIFLAGTFQFATWTAALLRAGETLQPSVRFGGREHALMFAKLGLYPCASLAVFASTCFLSRFSTAIFHLMQIGAPCAFLLLRLLLRLALAALRGLRELQGPVPGEQGQGQAEGCSVEDARAQLLPGSC